MAPPEVPMTAAGLPGQEVLPQGRAPQSMAFLSTAGIERLCSGVTNRRASEASISALKRATGAGTGCFVVLVVHRQVVDLDEFGLEGVGTELGQRLRQLAVDGLAPVRADDDAELVFCHGNLYLFAVTNEYQG